MTKKLMTKDQEQKILLDIITIRKKLYYAISTQYIDTDDNINLVSIDAHKKGDIRYNYNNMLIAYSDIRVEHFIYYAMRLIVLLQDLIPMSRGKNWYRLGVSGSKRTYVPNNKVFRNQIKTLCEIEGLYPVEGVSGD